MKEFVAKRSCCKFRNTIFQVPGPFGFQKCGKMITDLNLHRHFIDEETETQRAEMIYVAEKHSGWDVRMRVS